MFDFIGRLIRMYRGRWGRPYSVTLEWRRNVDGNVQIETGSVIRLVRSTKGI